MFGSPETTPGGRALKFYASLRLDVRRIDSIKQGTDVVGSRVKVKVVKNKVAPPFRVAEFDIMYNEGISKEGGLIDLAVELGLVKKTGAFFSYGELASVRGRENAREFPSATARWRRRSRRLIRQQTPRRQPRVSRSRANGLEPVEEADLATSTVLTTLRGLQAARRPAGFWRLGRAASTRCGGASRKQATTPDHRRRARAATPRPAG